MDTVGELMVRRDSVLEQMRFDTLDETWQREAFVQFTLNQDTSIVSI